MRECKNCKSEFYPNTPRNIYCWRCSGKTFKKSLLKRLIAWF